MTPARVAKIATARVRIAAALAEHRAPPVADPAHDLTPEEVEVLRSMLGRACVALPSPPTRLHELGLVRPVSVRGGDDAWEITGAGVGAHCAARSLARRVSNPRK